MATNASLQRVNKKPIQTAKQFYDWESKTMKNIKMVFYTKQGHQLNGNELKNDFQKRKQSQVLEASTVSSL